MARLLVSVFPWLTALAAQIVQHIARFLGRTILDSRAVMGESGDSGRESGFEGSLEYEGKSRMKKRAFQRLLADPGSGLEIKDFGKLGDVSEELGLVQTFARRV